MRLLRRCGWFAGLGPAALLVALFVVVGSARAAFPGRDGLLAVQPLKGHGVVLVSPNGRGERRVCPRPSSGPRPCSLVRPEWSPDGQTLAVGVPPSRTARYGPLAASVSVIYPDGSCLACQFSNGVGLVDAAFTSSPTLLTAVVPPEGRGAPGELDTFGLDGVARTSPALARGAISGPVWSSRGELAVVRGGWIWVGSPHSLHRLARGNAPSWSPDGSRIVFDRKGWLMVRRLQARTARRLVRGSAPAWSPDARWIAFFDPNNRLSVVRASGAHVRRVGRVRGRTVDWQPLPAKQPAACLTPPGTTVLASSDTAIVNLDSQLGVYGAGPWAVMDCVRADGRERVFASGFDNRNGASVSGAVLAGTLAALEVVPSCGTSTFRSAPSITVYDLQTGGASDYYGNGLSGTCMYEGVPPSIDPLLLNANGFAAWLVTQSNDAQQLYAHDSQGTSIVDSAPAGSGAAIGNVQLTSDQLTWTHDGTPHELMLQ